jgi:anaerobic ribonucleoside-triphosphate reductase activating protein
MLLHAFVAASRANGPGLRAVIYFQGCSLNCPGCWNPTSHKFRGTDLTIDSVVQGFEAAMRSSPLEGVTFSGGEPMQQAQALAELIGEIRTVEPSASMGMFTGYTTTELDEGRYATRPQATRTEKQRLWRIVRAHLAFAVMGRYDRTQPGTEALRTSKNQKLVLFSSRYDEHDFGRQFVEVGIDPSGTTVVTGFPTLGFPAF